MSNTNLQNAKKEIAQTLSLSSFAMRFIGVSFSEPKDIYGYFRLKLLFLFSILVIFYHVFGETFVIILALQNNPKIEEIIPLFHVCGYGALSIAKVSVLWYKKDVFGKLIDELATIWPVPPLDADIQALKDKSLLALKIAHKWYFYINAIGVWFYNLTPIGLYFYRWWDGVEDLQIGYVWVCWYPFDKTTPFNHLFVYIFEIISGNVWVGTTLLSVLTTIATTCIRSCVPDIEKDEPVKLQEQKAIPILALGVTCVWIMVSTDLLFSAMASHLCLLLRILQRRLLSLSSAQKTDDEYYIDILENIKLHQRLIRYCVDIEEAFTFVNLINVVLSSVTICCVVFVIVLLEPLLDISNKFFLGSALLQIFVLCYYADDIIYASMEVGDAAYNSGWYRTDLKCRRALIFLIQRSQKPIAFTAMKFMNISLLTFTSILTRAYSYFALLYTMYSER